MNDKEVYFVQAKATINKDAYAKAYTRHMLTKVFFEEWYRLNLASCLRNSNIPKWKELAACYGKEWMWPQNWKQVIAARHFPDEFIEKALKEN